MSDTLIPAFSIMNLHQYPQKSIADRKASGAGVSFLETAQAAVLQTADASEDNVHGTLEEMLKSKYPNLAYHVADASSSAWRTRNDYPHELIFQQNQDISEKLENWKPSGPNPQYTHFKGPLASKAVVVHPDAQKRMESDPEFTKMVMERIRDIQIEIDEKCE